MKNTIIAIILAASFAQAGTMVSGGGTLVNPIKMCPDLTGTFINGPTASSTSTYGYQIKSLKTASGITGYDMATVQDGNVGTINTVKVGSNESQNSGVLSKVDTSVTCKNQTLIVSETAGGVGELTMFALDKDKNLVVANANQIGDQVGPAQKITYQRQGATPENTSTGSTRSCIRTPMLRCMTDYKVEKDANGCYHCVPR